MPKLALELGNESTLSCSDSLIKMFSQKLLLVFILVLSLLGNGSSYHIRHFIPETNKNTHKITDPGYIQQPDKVKGGGSSFGFLSMTFGFLPKGTPIPPSGPSKKHYTYEGNTLHRRKLFP